MAADALSTMCLQVPVEVLALFGTILAVGVGELMIMQPPDAHSRCCLRAFALCARRDCCLCMMPLTAGLIKQSGVLSSMAPTVGLGQSREELAPEAEVAQETAEAMSQAEQEKKYFGVLAEEMATKRGGDKKKRKKSKKR